MYELVSGSIFDKKCEVIIIPCNSMGGVTSSMKNELMVNDITNHPGIKEPGTVIFEECKGGFTNATVIGFAASVNAMTVKSDVKYIYNICEEIKYYCKSNKMSLINIPLLGTGAGKLNAEEVFEIFKKNFEDENELHVRIFIYNKKEYIALLNKNKKQESCIKNPRVFVSYTGENEDNKNWVKMFVTKLRHNGVNAIVDMYHLKLGDDLAQWMTNQLCMADKVIMICDKCYAIKADSRKGGVGWETMIIQGDMMNSLSNKYIFIVREEKFDEGIPMYAKTKYSLQWAEEEISDEKLKELLYHIFDCEMEPELGEIPIDIVYKMKRN